MPDIDYRDIPRLASKYWSQYRIQPPTGDLDRTVMACTKGAEWMKCEARSVVANWNRIYVLWHELEEPGQHQ